MGRKKREASPSEDEWSDMLEPEQMDLWLEAQRCVSMAQSIQGIQAGVVEAAGLVKQFIQPEQFTQLVADQCGTEPPPTNCSLKQMVRWKHKSSDAVSDVTMAVLQGKVGQLRQKIEQRKMRDAEMAANEKKLAAMMLIFQQEMAALHNPASVVELDDGDLDGVGSQEGKEPLVDSAAAANTTAVLPPLRAAAAVEGTAGESGTPVVQNAVLALSPAAEAVPAAAGALVEPSPVRAAQAAAPTAAATARKDAAPAVSSAGKQQLAAGTTPNTVPAAAVAAGAPTAASPPVKRLKAEGYTSSPGQQPSATVAAANPAAAAAAAAKKAAIAAASKAASGKPGSVVVIPGDRSLEQAGIAAAREDERVRIDRAEAAEEAAAAARQEQQLSASLQAQGGPVLPPEGLMAASNTHRMFKNRMKVTAYMTPDNVDDKTAGVKAHLDDQLFRFLDDQQVILMSYELLQCDTGKAFLHPEPPPMLTVQAVADVVTFEPTPGDIICGVVRKLSHNSITLLVLGCISVAIERPFIPPDWEYDLNSHCWVPGGDYSKAVSRGDLMTCMLLSYPKLDPDQEEVLFNLEGSLLTANTGLCSWQWPRQQRLRQALAAHNGQAEAYGPEQEQQLQQQQKQLRQQKLTRRKLRPVEEVAAQSSDSEDDEPDQEQQQEQQTQPLQQHPAQQQEDGQLAQQPLAQQQQQQQQGKLSKEAKQVQKEAAKQAKREEKARLKAAHKAEKKAAKAAEKAARKEAHKAEKAAAKAQAKAEKRAREQQDAAAGEQPPAKKQKDKHEQQQVAVVQANGHADVQRQNGKQSSSKHKKDRSEKSSSKKDKAGK